jgi:cytochrome b6-f complex iron-sulfur subunit
MSNEDSKMSRREFLSWLLMGGGLAASYGLFSAYGVYYLFPRSTKIKRPIFVATSGELKPGQNKMWTAPDGQKVIISNIQGEMKALSNVCPHLGCKVHWKEVDSQFFCPCHAGVFDKNGTPVSGPPKAENKPLKQFELTSLEGAIYLQWEGA